MPLSVKDVSPPRFSTTIVFLSKDAELPTKHEPAIMSTQHWLPMAGMGEQCASLAQFGKCASVPRGTCTEPYRDRRRLSLLNQATAAC